MTVQEVLNTVNELKPNSIDDIQKIKWLIKLDEKILNQIIDTHYDINKSVSDYENERDTELIADCPYDELYISYIRAQIDYVMSDIGRYNNEMIMFNTQYEDYAKYINRTYLPKNITELKV